MSKILELERTAENHRRNGEFQQAIDALKELLTLDPNFVRAHLGLAVLCEKVGDHQSAVQHAEQAVTLEPNDPLNMVTLSVTYQKAFEATRDPIYIQKAEMARDRSH